MPPHLHFANPNPQIDWAQWPVTVPTAPTPWPPGPRLAGVSSFGFSGTNAHLVLAAAPETTASDIAPATVAPQLLTLSAKTTDALQALAGVFADHLQTTDQPLADICHTSHSGRTHHPQRLAVVADSAGQMHEALTAYATGQQAPGLVSGAALRSRPKVAFLFTGQGAQYVEMGRGLYESEPIFRQALDRCDELLRQQTGESLLAVLFPPAEAGPAASTNGLGGPDPERINQTGYTQPALFALEYALAQLWQAWGITPDFVLGHSVGEYAAACVAGVFSLEEGLRLIGTRGRLMQALPQNGAMVAVMADEDRVQTAIAPYPTQVAIAAINGPQSVVISGEEEAVATIAARLSAEGIKTQSLTVSHAFHSPLMQPMLDEFRHAAQAVDYAPPRIPLLSNLTGKPVSNEITNAGYWVRHVRQPVRFADTIQALHEAGCDIFLEIGPKPTLLGMARQVLDKETRRRGDKESRLDLAAPSPILYLPSLRSGRDDRQQMLESLGALYAWGREIDWAAVDPAPAPRMVELPTYPFQRQRYWVERTRTQQMSAVNGADGFRQHPLLGRRMGLAHLPDTIFEGQLGPHLPAFLMDHAVFETPVMPATGFLEMALAAGAGLWGEQPITLADVTIEQPLLLADDGADVVQVVLSPAAGAGGSFKIFSGSSRVTAPGQPASPWTQHVSGRVVPAGERPLPPPIDIQALRANGGSSLDLPAYYQQCQANHLTYGPDFQLLDQLWRQRDRVVGRIRLPAPGSDQASRYFLHPALLDGCLQAVGAVLFADAPGDAWLPTGFAQVHFYRRAGGEVWVQAQLQPTTAQASSLSADLRIYDADGQPVAAIEGLLLQRTSQAALLRAFQRGASEKLYHLAWRSRAAARQPLAADGRWLILADGGGVGEKLADRLQTAGANCLLVRPGPGYARLDGRHGVVNPSQPADFQKLLQALSADGSGPVQGIVHLWGLDGGDDLLHQTAGLTAGALHLVQALAQTASAPRLWLVTRGAQPVDGGDSRTISGLGGAPLWGLGKVIGLEVPALHCVCVDLAPGSAVADASEQIWGELGAGDGESQVAYRRGQRHVARLVRFDPAQHQPASPLPLPTQPFRMMLERYGVLDNLRPALFTPRPPGPNEVQIGVQATGLNFRDVLNALGMLKEYYAEHLGIREAADVGYGFECAGIITAIGPGVTGLAVGDAVIAAMTPGSLASSVTVRADYVVAKPPNLTFAEAATLPLAFLTAWYGLKELACLRPGDRVLIHAAAGGVGQAAVQVAQRAGAEVFATASPAKWDALRQMGVSHVMNSRTLDFADEVMALTGGAGVDVVLNSLNGDYIEKSLAVLAQGGRFVEIGKLGIWPQARFHAARPDAAYFPFDLGEAAEADPRLVAAMLGQIMGAISDGSLGPLPYGSFPVSEVVAAFRRLQQAKQIGKVVVTMPGATTPSGHSSPALRGDGAYLITGGLGGLGLVIANWLVEQGVRHLVLTGRNPQGTEAIAKLKQRGVTVQIVQADVAQADDVARLLQESQRLAPLRGIFHAAGVLDDGLLSQQSAARFATVFAPKVAGAWHLHQQSQGLPLDFFVCFSSMASLVGSAGQGNYAAANGFMDALAHHRHALGLPGLSINWGAWSSVGMAARSSAQQQNRLAGLGIQSLAPDQAMQIFARLLAEDVAQVGVLPVHWPTYLQQFAPGAIPGLLAELAPQTRPVVEPSMQAAQIDSALQTLPTAERSQALAHYLRKQAAQVLGLPAGQLDVEQPFNELGLDSLMTVELRNRLQNDLQVDVPLTHFLTGLSVNDLTHFVTETLEKKEANRKGVDPKWGDPKKEVDPKEGKPAGTHGSGQMTLMRTAQAFDPLVPMQTKGTRPPLFCIHPWAGMVYPYYELAQALGPDQPIYGFQALGIIADTTDQTVEAMSERYVARLLAVQPKGPYYLTGWSLGGLVAYEMARQLERLGKSVALVAILDMPPFTNQRSDDLLIYRFLLNYSLPYIWPHVYDYFKLVAHQDNGSGTDENRFGVDAPDIGKDGGKDNGRAAPLSLLKMGPSDYLSSLTRPLGMVKTISREIVSLTSRESTGRRIFHVLNKNMAAMLRYRAKPYGGRILFVRTPKALIPEGNDPTLGWGSVADCDIEWISGHHLSLLRAPYVQEVAAILKRRIDLSL
ncbi:MAG: SDR family NAD(P)-dependent oxidoreductase [Caldilineaceae bacterium]|nr:SDR family NAD(P)-dependent oxidoreductase [Caldilineaceae bacterium]